MYSFVSNWSPLPLKINDENLPLYVAKMIYSYILLKKLKVLTSSLERRVFGILFL